MRQFGGDPSIIGKTITLNRSSFTVVGITPEGFRGPNAVATVGVWLPLNATPVLAADIDMQSRSSHWIDALGRRAPGVGVEQVSAAFDRLIALIKRTRGDDRTKVRTRLIELFELFDPADPEVIAGRRNLANALY